MPLLEGQGDGSTGKGVLDSKKDILRPGLDNHWGMFVDGNGIFAQANSGNMLPGYNSQSGGITAGLTYKWNENVGTGIYCGYQGTYTKSGADGSGLGTGSRLIDNAVRFGVFGTYGQKDGKGLFVNALAGGGYHNFQATRVIQYAGMNRTANSVPGAGELDTMLAAGYDIKKPDNLPDGAWNEEEVNGFKALAHDIGLTPAQAAKLAEFDNARMARMDTKSKQGLESFINSQRDELKKDWGDGYDSKIEAAKIFAQEASDHLKVDLLKSGYANDAVFIKLAEYAYQCTKDARKEDKFVASNKVGLGLTDMDQAEDIRRNPQNPLHAAFHGRETKERQLYAQQQIMRLSGVKDTTL
jgi:hypothetical protein